ncbi:MAG TPA: cytochrome c biogenesis protein CcsA [Alphaproteobacteria bacterium]|nr:cytochrome c biogenesis protein CcsA [Alphaproteobacteria bacterium]HNS43722.1 cytochrome c biogenesis protein CcsA [Alphaproteobacteria bacterium]
MTIRLFLHSLFLVLFCFAGTAFAKSEDIDLSAFAQIPILHDGRIKPLDTFARNELIRFSGKSTFEGQSAVNWLAETIFDPVASVRQNIFKIENGNVRHLLGLEERKKPLYAFTELTTGLEKTFPTVEQLMGKDAKTLSGEQKALLTLHENALEYTQLLRSFSLLLPLNVSIPSEWQEKLDMTAGEPATYLSLKKIDTQLEQQILAIIKKKGENPTRYTPFEQQTAVLGWQIKTIEQAAQNNTLFRVIPNDWDKKSGEWIAPWDMISSGKGSPRSAEYLKLWQDLAMAWQLNKPQEWSSASLELSYLAPGTLSLELLYNQIGPFQSALIFFAVSFLFTLLALSLGRSGWLIKFSAISMLVAIVLQGGGLAARIILLDRPPVGTLYESILFVGLVAPLFAILFERKLKNHIGLLCAGLMGTGIGLLGLSMADEGDTMKVLTAVLNTRFWLTTHVLCITIGYGWCLVTSVLAHMILIGEATGKTDNETLKSMRHSLGTLALTALLFTATGTILGGVWADQSWGRFWGWDPKENGALLITLWLIWIIHGKVAGQISPLVQTAGLAFVSVIVGIAWIGVNLLGVGLHSYGFIEGLFWGLGAFALFELMLIGALSFRISQKEASHETA